MIEPLNVKDPNSYQCLVYSYQAGHGHLGIKINKIDDYYENNHFELDFGDVMYFSGPFVWKGINLEEGPLEECISIISSFSSINLADKKFLEQYHLYKLRTVDGFVIKIVAKYVLKQGSSSNAVSE